MIATQSEFESLIFQYGRACREAAIGRAPESEAHETFGALHRAICEAAVAAMFYQSEHAARIAAEAERDKAHEDAISAAVERDELRARLAEIEAQEPICHREESGNRVVMNTSGGPGKWRERQKYHGPLYAGPTPAQAGPAPDGWRLFAWAHEDGRVIPVETMDTAKRDGGATLSSVKAYTIPLYAAPERKA